MTARTVEEKATVSVDYTLTLDSGEEIDSSKGRGPLTFTVGGKQVIRGFEEGMKGLKVGDEKDILVAAADGYGAYRQELVQEVPKTLFKDFNPDVGQMIGLMGKDGRQLQAKVIAVGSEKIKLDLNHPLAGQQLHFHVKVMVIA